MADERYEIRIAGSGGQGVILATELIGQAITYHEPEFYVVQSQAYGPEARGGKSKAEVVISSKPIDYPKVIAPSLQIILTQAAADEFAPDTMPGGRIVYDDFFVTDIPGMNLESGAGSVEAHGGIDARVYSLPIIKTAREKLGREIVTNMVALGCVGRVLELEKIASPDSLRKVADLNVAAFDAGYEIFRNSPLPD